MWEAGGGCHADAQGFFYYGGEVGEGLDVLFLFSSLGIIEKFGAEGFVSIVQLVMRYGCIGRVMYFSGWRTS